MLDLKSKEGELITGVFRPIDPNSIKIAKLHRVEAYGIWIESQDLINRMLSDFKVPQTPRTLVVFIPWSEVYLIVDSADGPSLSEFALGL